MDETISVVSSRRLLETGVLKKTGRSVVSVHMGADRLQGKQAVVSHVIEACAGVLDHRGPPPGMFLRKDL